jgi:integrase/recombinase XerD
MTVSKPRLEQAELLAQKSPAFKNFMRGLTNKHTLSDYARYNFDFMKFHNLGKDYDSLVKNEPKTISKMITDYLDYCMERGVKNSTLRSYLMGIERMFIMNDCIWHKDRIRSGIGTDEEIPGGRVPVTTEELWTMLQHTKSLRTKCLVHFLADTGMRPAGLVDPVLRMKHLVELKTPNGQKCYSLKIYEGSKSGYWVFLTPETTKLLDRYITSRRSKDQTIDDETPIFDSERRLGNSALTAEFARVTIANLIKSSGVQRTKVSKFRYDKSVMYMFRKRFNTILKLHNEVNSNIAEKLMAHKRGLDGTYLQPTMEECFAEFVKAIPELTIDPTEKQKNKIKSLEDEKNDKIQNLEKTIQNMQSTIEKRDSEWNDEIVKLFEEQAKKFSDPNYIKQLQEKEIF